MIFQPRSIQYPRRRMSPPALLAVLVFHGLLLWLVNQHWPIERAVRYVVFQTLRPVPQASPQEAPASRAISTARSMRSATELSVFAKTVESSVPLRTTNQLPETTQAKTKKPGPGQPAEAPPEAEPAVAAAEPPPVPQAEVPPAEPVPQARVTPPVEQPPPVTPPPVTPPPEPAPVPAPVPPAPVPQPAPVPPPPVPVPPPPVPVPPAPAPPPVVAPAPVPVPEPVPTPAPAVAVQPPEPVRQPEPVAQPAPPAPAAPAAQVPLETMVEQPRSTRRLRGPVVDVPVSPTGPASTSVAVPVLVLPPVGAASPGAAPGTAPGAVAGPSASPAAGPSTGPAGPPGPAGGPATASPGSGSPGGSGPAGASPSAGVPAGRAPAPALAGPTLPSAAMSGPALPAPPASRPVLSGMPPPPMPGTYRVLPQFRRNLADMANEQLRRGNPPDPMATAIGGSELPDCTRPQSGTETLGGLLAAPSVAARVLSGRCK